MNMFAFTIALALLAIIFGGWLYIFRDSPFLGALCGACGVFALVGAFLVSLLESLARAL